MSARAILVIDDEAALRYQLQIVLQKSGYQVFSAGDAEQGIALLDAHSPPIEVMLTDLILPNTDGMDILRHIQQRGLDVSVIVMTAFGSMGRVTDALRLGAYDFLTKPFNLTAMLLAVSRAFDRQRLRTEVAKQEKLATTLELAGAVAHRVNQPLMIIVGTADLLLNELDKNDPLCCDLEMICDAVTQMATQVRQIAGLPDEELGESETRDEPRHTERAAVTEPERNAAEPRYI
jgi:FixJ family two-component response regulator